DIPALREAGGQVARYVAPGDVTGFVAELLHLLDDASLREQLGAAGRLRAAEHTWQVTAERTLRVYQSVVSGPSR
ncbi:MAG: group 1 glycosyl transferase, partial [Chloroflexi bacterium]